MSAHASFFLTKNTKIGKVTIASSAAGNVDFGASNGFNCFWIMPVSTADPIFTWDVADSTGTALTSLSATAAAGAGAACPSTSRVVATQRQGRYVNLYNHGSASCDYYVMGGQAPA